MLQFKFMYLLSIKFLNYIFKENLQIFKNFNIYLPFIFLIKS